MYFRRGGAVNGVSKPGEIVWSHGCVAEQGFAVSEQACRSGIASN
jgi:hypothetical protein